MLSSWNIDYKFGMEELGFPMIRRCITDIPYPGISTLYSHERTSCSKQIAFIDWLTESLHVNMYKK